MNGKIKLTPCRDIVGLWIKRVMPNLALYNFPACLFPLKHVLPPFSEGFDAGRFCRALPTFDLMGQMDLVFPWAQNQLVKPQPLNNLPFVRRRIKCIPEMLDYLSILLRLNFFPPNLLIDRLLSPFNRSNPRRHNLRT